MSIRTEKIRASCKAKCSCLIGDSGNLQLRVALKKSEIYKFFVEKEGNFPAICLAGYLQGSQLAGTKGSRLVGQLQADKEWEPRGFLAGFSCKITSFVDVAWVLSNL